MTTKHDPLADAVRALRAAHVNVSEACNAQGFACHALADMPTELDINFDRTVTADDMRIIDALHKLERFAAQQAEVYRDFLLQVDTALGQFSRELRERMGRYDPKEAEEATTRA